MPDYVTRMLKKEIFAAVLALACNCAVAQDQTEVALAEDNPQNADPATLVQLAEKYESGDNPNPDYAKSNSYYCEAAKRGYAPALVKLGLIYSNGRGVPEDEGTAALLFSKAADLGDEQGKRLLEYVARSPSADIPSCLVEAPAAVTVPAPGATPKAIEKMVAELAPQYSVDPKLVMALISVESNFQVDAVSAKSAQGLMQLIPATAERFGVKQITNPTENLKGGLAYLRWLLAFFQGNVPLVLAAYNAGEDAVERYRGIPPYSETRDYVKKITALYKNTFHPYLSDVVAPSKVLNLIERKTK